MSLLIFIAESNYMHTRRVCQFRNFCVRRVKQKKIHLEKIPKLHLNEIFFIIFGLHGALAQLVRAADS